MDFLTAAGLFIALLGHGWLWLWLFNRLHAGGFMVRHQHRWSYVCELSFLTLPLLVVGSHGIVPLAPLKTDFSCPLSLARGGYLAVCWLAAVGMAVALFGRRGPQSAALLDNHTRRMDLAADLDRRPLRGTFARLCGALPGNEILHLAVHEKTLRLHRLPPGLEGLSILHLSDLHFSGRIEKVYFDRVFDQAAALEADLVAITGDLLDRRECFDWLADTLGRLQARHGVYFIPGNHDLRIDAARLRRQLRELGLVDLLLGPQVVSIAGQRVLLAGNAAPWFALPDSALPAADLRILLSHSPDQFPWAQAHHFDLMLAGHTHGGQICLPWIGPVASCSRFGCRWVSGVYEHNGTLLHTTRGISGLQPLRYNCPPELARLTLTRA